MHHQPYLPLPPIYRRIRVHGRIEGADPSMHHLQCVNGVFCVRASVDQGPKLVAKRVKTSLGNCPVEIPKGMEAEVAKWVRDKCLEFASSCGAVFSDGNRFPEIERFARRRKRRATD